MFIIFPERRRQIIIDKVNFYIIYLGYPTTLVDIFKTFDRKSSPQHQLCPEDYSYFTKSLRFLHYNVKSQCLKIHILSWNSKYILLVRVEIREKKLQPISISCVIRPALTVLIWKNAKTILGTNYLKIRRRILRIIGTLL